MAQTAGDSDGGVQAALHRLYGDREPDFRWTTVQRWDEGGPDPLDEILVYARDLPMPHWHYVGVGLTHGASGSDADAGAAEPEDVAIADDGRGWTFELTARLAREGDREHEHPPAFMANVLQNLARYVVESGNPFGPGHTMDLHGAIQLGGDTPVGHVLFVADPELGDGGGSDRTDQMGVEFLQVVGLTADEVAAKKTWSLEGFAALFAERYPLLVTRLDRKSILSEPAVSAALAAGRARDGSSTAGMAVATLGVAVPTRIRSRLGSPATITIDAGTVEGLRLQLPLRISFGRPFTLHGPDLAVTFVPDESVPFREHEHEHEHGRWLLGLSSAQADALARTLAPSAGTYAVDGWPKVRFVVLPTHIRDQHGDVVATIG